MSLVDGVGGVFLFSKDPKRLADWYADIFGIEFSGDAGPTTFYTVFWSRAEDDTERRVDCNFAIMALKRDLPSLPTHAEEPTDMYGDQHYMLNLRVSDLAQTLAHLSEKGVPLIGTMDEPYGRFAWVRDADGNRVELYEPKSHAASP
ncbi:MAG: VOC family protein [Myxococcota bacterium]